MITTRLGGVILMTAMMASLPGCSGEILTVPTTTHLGQLTFRGGVNVAESFPVQLGFTLEIRNRANRDVELLSDGCGILPRAYRTADRDQRPVWDTRRDGVSQEPCRAFIAPLSIPAGKSKRLIREYAARDVLGDSLPDGRYHFSVTYRASLVDSEEVRVVEVTAGEARLEPPR